MNRIRHFFAELKRRRVIKASIAYVAASWILIEVSGAVFPALLLPDWAHRLVVILAVIAFPIVVVLAWVFDISPGGITQTQNSDGSTAEPARLTGSTATKLLPPAPDSAIASICVLPFEVLSSNDEDKYIAQGVGAELTSALSKLSAVRVVPRAAAAEGEDVRELGARLGVHYVLNGNLRRSGEKIRIIVDLTDARSGGTLWSETYNRVLDDVMEVEEEIAGAIVGSFSGEQLKGQVKTANIGETKNATAWGLVHKARSYVLNYSQKSLGDAEGFVRDALELDPDYAAAHATLADVLCERVTSGLSDDPDTDLGDAVASIEKAIARTPNDPFVLKLAGNVFFVAGQYQRAQEALRHAVEISPFDLGAWGYLASTLAATDDEDQLCEAHKVLDRILEMAPQHPGAGFWWHHKALASTCQGDYENAATYARRAVRHQPQLAWAWYLQANALAQTGHEKEARDALASAATANANLSAEKFAATVRRSSASEKAAERRLAGLTAQGII